MNFKHTLNRLLADRKMSVAEMSLRSGIPKQTIYHWLSGQQPRKIDHIFRVSELFNLSVEELFGRPSRKISSPLPMRSLEGDLNAGIYEVILRPTGVSTQKGK